MAYGASILDKNGKVVISDTLRGLMVDDYGTSTGADSGYAGLWAHQITMPMGSLLAVSLAVGDSMSVTCQDGTKWRVAHTQKNISYYSLRPANEATVDTSAGGYGMVIYDGAGRKTFDSRGMMFYLQGGVLGPGATIDASATHVVTVSGHLTQAQGGGFVVARHGVNRPDSTTLNPIMLAPSMAPGNLGSYPTRLVMWGRVG